MSGTLYEYSVSNIQLSPTGTYLIGTIGGQIGTITSYTLNGTTIVTPGTTFTYQGFDAKYQSGGYGFYDTGTTEVWISSVPLTAGAYTAVPDPTGSLFASAPCFLAGTHIATVRGEVLVEDLREGDEVLLARGGTAPVRWVGHRRIRSSVQPLFDHLWPIRIHAGALAAGIPARDLLLSPEHAMWIEGKLVPVRHLVNGTSIVQEKRDDFTYYHVELPQHDVLLAEGAAAESWLDTGNRDMFENAPIVSLRADTRVRATEVWAEKACGELLEHGPALDAIRASIGRLAFENGFDGRGLVTMSIDRSGIHTAEIPAGVSLVRIISERFMPPGEQRHLGVAVRGLTLDGANVPLDDPRLRMGFFPIEGVDDLAWRWTDGHAVLVVGTSDVPRQLTVDLSAVAAAQPLRAIA